jgi:catechol 2,3-dioxygenase-like lactoylglutathione lyase family enzyme
MPRPEAKAILNTAWGVIPHFSCRSVPRTVQFYTQDLHFNLGGAYEDNPDHGAMCSVFIGKGAMKGNIYLFQAPKAPATEPAGTATEGPTTEEPGGGSQREGVEGAFRTSRAAIALGTDAVDEYYDLLRREGRVEIVEHVEDKPWGYRQFMVRDPDGNEIQFFRFLEGGNPGNGRE